MANEETQAAPAPMLVSVDWSVKGGVLLQFKQQDAPDDTAVRVPMNAAQARFVSSLLLEAAGHADPVGHARILEQINSEFWRELTLWADPHGAKTH